MDAVDALKNELGYADVEPALKRVVGVYRQLQTLEKQARVKPQQYLAKYKALLSSAIERAKSNAVVETPLDPDSEPVRSAMREYIAALEALWVELNIDKVSEERQPSNPWEWMRRWHPALSKAVDHAEERLNKSLTLRNLELLKGTQIALLKTYRNAIDGESRASGS